MATPHIKAATILAVPLSEIVCMLLQFNKLGIKSCFSGQQ